jgi:hypothetical protein
MSGEEAVEAAPPRAENGTEHEACASEVGKTAAWYYAIGCWAMQWPPYPFTVLSIKLARRVPEVITLARIEATA